MKRHSPYMAYLLRMWCEESDDQPIWRASVEIPGPGKQQIFPTFEALVAFLEAEMAKQEAQDRTEQ